MPRPGPKLLDALCAAQVTVKPLNVAQCTSTAECSMKIYRITLSTGDEGIVQAWAGSKDEAKRKLREMKGNYEQADQMTGDIEAMDIPTDKAGLLSWLNAYFDRDNG